MNSHHRQRSVDGKMKIYRKPASTTTPANNNVSGNCSHSLLTSAVNTAVSLDKPRKRNDRNTNVYACFPPPNKSLFVPSETITNTCSITETSPASSSGNYKLSSLSAGICSSSSTPSTSPHAHRRNHRQTAKSNAAVDAANHLEALSIDALYDKIRGNADNARQSSVTAAKSSRTVDFGRNRDENAPSSTSGTTKTIPQTPADGDDVDDIYFDLSALNINFKQHQQNQTRSSYRTTADPWRSAAVLPPANGVVQSRVPNIFFSFDDNADIYSLHSLPLRSPTLVPVATAVNRQQHADSSLPQRRQLPELPVTDHGNTMIDKNRSGSRRQLTTDKPLVTYRRQHRPVTAASSSASTQPLLSPAPRARNPATASECRANDAGGSITCARCHKCRCCACREPLGRIDRVGRLARSCVEFGTCMWCARRCIDDDDEDENDAAKTRDSRLTTPQRRTCSRRSSSAGFFSGRRLKLAVMSLVCPCLCLYKPLKCGGKVCDKLCKRVLAHRACLCEQKEDGAAKNCVPADSAPTADGENKRSMLLYADDHSKILENNCKNQDLLFVSAAATSTDVSYDFLASFLSTSPVSSSSSTVTKPSSDSSSSSTDNVFK